MALGVDGYWLPVKDGDPRARALYLRHYSQKRYVDGRRRTLFVGPAERMVLMTVDGAALFIWKAERIRHDGQTGINCSVFRNEGPVLSSLLVREADALASARWPGERHFTYVNPGKIRSTNPGVCFIKAGWNRLKARSKGGLVILERMPPP